MARRKTTKDLSASILAGSEETFDFFCEPCSLEQHLEAAGYCQQCSQYLCTTCIKYHGKLAVSAHHTVLDKSVMPKTKVPKAVKNIDILTEKCGKHPDKVLEYFCKSHNEICCSVCVTLDHSSCSDKNYIPDVSSGIATSLEYRRLNEDLDWLVNEITRRQDKNNDSTTTNEKYQSDALTNIKVFRKEINEFLDKIEEDTKGKFTPLYQQNVSAIRNSSEKCKSLLSEVNLMSEQISKVSKAGPTNQLFVQVKRASHRIAEMEKRLNKDTECNVTHYSFDKDEQMQQMMSTLTDIWSISVRQKDTPTKARYVRQINVKTDDDENECFVSGIEVLPKGRVVVADYNNQAVKLFDIKQNKIISRLPVSSAPSGTTKIKSDQVAVCFEEKIEIITVSDSLSKSRTIGLPGTECHELCYDRTNIITVCGSSSINVFDMSGTKLQTFSTDRHGEKLFTEIDCIDGSRDKNVVYIADFKAHQVTAMTTSGHVISVYRHDELNSPTGVAVGKDGAVYVCSHDNNTVHQLTSTGEFKRIILRHDNGIVRPCNLACGTENDMLYISSKSAVPENDNYIKLYQLE